MSSFAWAITASFICTAAAAWFSGYVIGAHVACRRNDRSARGRLTDVLGEAVQKQMDEAHEEDKDG